MELSGARVHDPHVFIEALRQFHQTHESKPRGELANMLSDAIITKRVDLSQVRLALLEGGEADLLDELDRLIDLIEPYIEEGGVDE